MFQYWRQGIERSTAGDVKAIDARKIGENHFRESKIHEEYSHYEKPLNASVVGSDRELLVSLYEGDLSRIKLKRNICKWITWRVPYKSLAKEERRYEWVRDVICIIISFTLILADPGICTIEALQSPIPIVEGRAKTNESSTNRWTREVLPTPGAPTSIKFTTRS